MPRGPSSPPPQETPMLPGGERGRVPQRQNQGKEMTDKETLRKYGRHLRSCELVEQPYSDTTDSYWSCTCGFSEALGCQLCEKKGYVVNLPIPKGGYYTGHCPECGNI